MFHSRFGKQACVLGCAGGILALTALAVPARAQNRIKVGEEVPYAAATPVSYPWGAADRPVVWSEVIVSPGATFLRVHFRKLDLPDGDYLTVTGADGEELWTYTGKGPRGTGEFWSFSVEGDTAFVELHGGPRRPAREGRRYGVVIDRVAHGTISAADLLPPPDAVICGTDGRQNVACYTGINTRPVARLSFQSGGSSYVCTGWLVKGSNNSTMLTNNHCFTTQSETNTVQARFNYQTTTCTGSTVASTTTYAGGTFLKTSSSLDYTLFTLQGNPEATWGEYTATTKTPSSGMSINFPQHPGGGLKKIAYWKDSAKTLRCNVTAANQSISGYSSSSQMTYSCDSEGGSSGSPIMDAGTGRILGLHHLGNVSGSSCLNAATQMKNVCSNAGSLLTCASN